MNINQVTLGGNITRDPELKYSPAGISICTLSIANNRRWKTKDGEKKEEVIFIDCTFFGKTGETVAQYFRKGSRIMVQGRLSQDRWEDKEGRKRTTMKVVCNEFFFVDKGQVPQPAAAESTRPSITANAEDDDVPF